ncbi:MAG: hypothetical protein AAGE80_01920 [Pseudomonadota bacterium]
MGRPIGGPPQSREDVVRSNIRFARLWVCLTPLTGLVWAATDYLQPLSWYIGAVGIIAIMTFMILVMGCTVVFFAYARRLEPRTMVALSIIAALVGLLQWDWQAMGAAMLFGLLLAICARSIYELFFCEDQLVEARSN